MRDIFDLTGEVVLLTGASSGLGAHFAGVLMEHGASVALVARREDRLDQVRESLLPRTYGNPGAAAVCAYPFDVVHGPIGALFERIEADIGPISILVNNAGIGHLDRALDLAREKWDEVLAVDLEAPFVFTQEAARRMTQPGSIINVASIFGQMGSKGMLAYAVAKAGLIQMTKSLAVELADRNVRVNALCPGWFVTDMTRRYLDSPRGATIAQDIPLARFGQPSDLDGALLLLASDAGRYITGTTLTIDGGLSVCMRDGRKVEMAQKTPESVQ